MTVTSGFFNGVDRATNATDISAIFDGLISDGIYDSIGSAFAVTAAGGNYLNLGTGRAWFNHTWTRNDAVVVYEAPASDLLLSRYDCMVLEVDHSDPVRNNRIFILSGTPSSNPVLPELSAGPDKFQYILASILRAPNSTEIAAIDITPYQGTAQTPFVNGLLEKFDITDILNQYRDKSLELIDDLEVQLLVVQQTGIPIHHSTHVYGASDAIDPKDILAAGKSIIFDANLLASGWGADCANLFDDAWSQGSINNSTGVEETSPNYIRSTNYTTVVGGSSYSYADSIGNGARIFWYTASAFVSYSDVSHNGTVSAPATATRMKIRLYNASTITPSSIRWAMFNSGATAKEWEPRLKGIHIKVADYAALAGVTNISAVEVIAPRSKNITQSEIAALQAANVFDGTQVAGSEIVLHARGAVPTINLPVRIIVRGDLY